jgi:hypothetical protein
MGSTIDNTSILTKGLQSDLNTTEIVDGMLRFTTDTGRLYLDVDSTRVLISETVDLYTEAQIKSLLAPLPKVYVSSDTHRSFVYSYSTLSWVDLADVKLAVSPSENVEKVLWFSETTDTQPEYDASMTYNTSTDTLTVPNIKTTITYVGNMRIQNAENADHSHTITFDFV